mmetsp:Transcript_25396/g.59092  ORF Transcript_25396/g.59092 Transcript_25396/m.59092 type:complete len:202 (-) Transcript_25396:1150-1755(-)
MYAVGVLQGVEGPSLLRHEIANVEHREVVRAKAQDHSLRIAQNKQSINLLHFFLQAHTALNNLLRALHEALLAQRGQTRPARSRQRARPAAGDGGSHVKTARPVRVGKVLVLAELRVAVEHDRGALARVAIFVRVHRHGGDAREAKVEVGDVDAGDVELFGEGEDETAKAAVDVKADTASHGHLAELLNRVDDSVGKVRGR